MTLYLCLSAEISTADLATLSGSTRFMTKTS